MGPQFVCALWLNQKPTLHRQVITKYIKSLGENNLVPKYD